MTYTITIFDMQGFRIVMRLFVNRKNVINGCKRITSQMFWLRSTFNGSNVDEMVNTIY